MSPALSQTLGKEAGAGPDLLQRSELRSLTAMIRSNCNCSGTGNTHGPFPPPQSLWIHPCTSWPWDQYLLRARVCTSSHPPTLQRYQHRLQRGQHWPPRIFVTELTQVFFPQSIAATEASVLAMHRPYSRAVQSLSRREVDHYVVIII